VQHSGAIVQRVDDLHVFRRVKSNTFRFSATRSGLDDRETTTLFNCRFQRTGTWAGVRPYSAAIDVTVGSSINLPTPSGL
jgi:hypothetical protein